LIYSEEKKMNYQKMQNNYLQNQVMSASPNKLIEMLLQAAIKNIKLASQCQCPKRGSPCRNGRPTFKRTTGKLANDHPINLRKSTETTT